MFENPAPALLLLPAAIRDIFCSGKEYIMGDVLQPRELPRGVSFEDVWAMFQETREQMRETDRRMQETDKKMQKTDRQIREMTARTDKQIGKLGNRFGEMVEHLIIPNIVEKFRSLGYTFTRAGLDTEFFSREGKALAEVDAWLENGDFAMAVEIKSRLREQDTDRHAKRMEILRAYLDEREDTRKLLGAVAGAVVTLPAKEYALERGFYVIEQSGDTVKIAAPEGFTPKVW
jgi:predicted AAA+ superfamily ATPase